MKIKYVEQPTRTSCGIACIMMLSGVSFEEGRKLVERKGLTTTKNIVKALNKIGIKNSGGLIRLKKNKSLPEYAMCKVVWDTGRSHWVLWGNKLIFDPAYPNQYTTDYVHLKGKITSYIELYDE